MSAATELREQAERLLREADALDAKECTGLAAEWCPVCGDCVCPERENALDDPDCPLHSPTSIHAETEADR